MTTEPSDLVERVANGPYTIGPETGEIRELAEAADEIERLRAVLAEIAETPLYAFPPAQAEQNATLVEALTLAANRLELHAVNAIAAGDLRSMEYSDWVEEARATPNLTNDAVLRERNRALVEALERIAKADFLDFSLCPERSAVPIARQALSTYRKTQGAE